MTVSTKSAWCYNTTVDAVPCPDHAAIYVDHWVTLSICRDSKQKLGDVLKPLVSFFKLTSEYVINVEHARNTITEWQKKSPTFAKVISSVEVSNLALSCCANVKFQHTVHIKVIYNCAKFHLPVICIHVANVLKYFIKL